MRPPVDQEIRDAAARELGTSFFLEAGAGTGKTTILVDRVLEIVGRGAAPIGEVVVITFTEKAAGELRARIRASLHAEAENCNDPELEERFLAALRGLDGAHIETIHAFASSVLRERPLEAGVDPNFQQLDEVGDELDFDERWRDWIWSVGGESVRAIERCLQLDLPLEEIRRVARRLAEYRDVRAASDVSPVPDAGSALQRLRDVCESAREATAGCLNPDDWCFRIFTRLTESLDQLAAGRPAAVQPGLNRLQVKLWKGALRNWSDPSLRERVFVALEEISSVLTGYQTALRTSALAALVNALSGFVEQAARDRIREGKLNFEDLLIEARRVIVENAEVRRYLQQRYSYILVDEFQDTDPIQAEIVFLLAASEGAGAPGAAPAWTEVTLEPGKLFLVGDPKQSIYRFRRADIVAFMKARRVFERQREEGRPARVETIGQNFRSVPEVVAWVNDLFRDVIQRDPDHPFAQPDYEGIEAYRPAAGEPRVIHLYPVQDLGGEKIDHVREQEAHAVARLVAEMVDSPEWKLSAPAGDGSGREESRGVRYRDVCLLVENRTRVEIYTDALVARGIPFVLDGGREFFQRQEVKDIAAILRALDDPSDEVSLVAALKSEAFACSDVELLEYRLGGGRFSVFADAIEGDAVAAAVGRLKALYEEKAHHSLPAFVDRVVRESFLAEARLLDPGGRQRAANLRLIVQRAVDFAANEVDSLRPFIRWISERQRERGQETESQVNESDDDVVRITTVHGAKGLEFPVVFLAKLAGGKWSERDYRVVDREANRLEFQVGKEGNRFSTPRFDEAWETESVYEDAENRRLLYVAATRARDYLVVPVYAPAAFPGRHVYLGAVPSRGAVVGAAERPTFAGARVLLDGEIPGRERPPQAPPTLPADLVPRWEERLERVRERAAAGPKYVVPSRLVDDGVKEPRETEPRDRSEDEVDPDVQSDTQRAIGFADGAAGVLFVGSSGARQRGALVHDVLYRCDLGDPGSASRWARRLCRERGAEALTPEVERHARAVLGSPFMGRVLAARRVLREVPVAWLDGETFVEGFADLAFEEPDGWVVMDYKTDSFDGDPTALARRYRPQVEAYGRALTAAGMNVKEAGLWFSASGETVVVNGEA